MPSQKHLTMKTLPVEDRPTEKLQRLGAAALSEAELLAVIIRSGTHRETALALSQRLLQDLQLLQESSFEELQLLHGVGEVRAAQIKAILELGHRLQLPRAANGKPRIRDPRDAIRLLEGEMRLLRQEEMRVILLDSRHRVIRIQTIAQGTLNSAVTHPRDLFREALKANAAAVIMAHNHPSGDARPSPEDLAATRRFVEVGELTGIPVVDHLIISSSGSLSLKERGEI